jgi:IS5 family transposase
MPETIRRANNAKSIIRSRVEHVFAKQKNPMGLFIRTIRIAWATYAPCNPNRSSNPL